MSGRTAAPGIWVTTCDDSKSRILEGNPHIFGIRNLRKLEVAVESEHALGTSLCVLSSVLYLHYEVTLTCTAHEVPPCCNTITEESKRVSRCVVVWQDTHSPSFNVFFWNHEL